MPTKTKNKLVKENTAYSFPVFRIGRICSSKQKFSDKDIITVSRNLINDYESIIEKVFHKLPALGCKNITLSKKERLLIRHYECPIANFPSFDFSTKDFHITCRPSIALCVKGHNTKIWLRFSLNRIKNHDAFNMSRNLINNYFESSEKVALKMSNLFKNEYFLFLKKIGKHRKTEGTYNFIIKTTNSRNRKFNELTNMIHDFEINGIDDILESEEYTHILFNSFTWKFDKKERRPTKANYSKFINRENKWLGINSNSALGVFLLDIKKGSTCASGVTYNNSKKNHKDQPAEECSRAILKHFACKL
jgi:uncharacterized protein YchJ